MGSLSSDSSDDDLDEYIATNTLLGYASKDPTDDPVNQLGGRPVSTALDIGPIILAPANIITFSHGPTQKTLHQQHSRNAKSAIA